jgi:CheY-like chemotaxis protein
MITASSSPDDMMEALLSGSCDDYLTKPVMHKTLIELLQKHNLV